MRRVAALMACAVAFAALSIPASASASPPPDWLAGFSGPSPTCRQALVGQPAANCRGSGTVESPYPLGHYAFDWHIQAGVTHPQNSIAALLEWLASLVWTVTLTALNVVLAALQWSFSLDILHGALAPLRSALHHLHDDALGRPWQTVAFGLLGLVALYHGVVRQDVAEGVVGSATAIVLIAAGLYIIQRPEQTLGPLSALANQAGGGFLAGAAAGDAAHADQGVADASAAWFDASVTRPWCAIEFGDVGFCLSRAPGGLTWGQRWLRYPSGSRQRDAEYAALAGDALPGTGHGPLGICDICIPDQTGDVSQQVAGVHRDPSRVAFQTTGATVPRAAIVMVMCVGLWCGIALIGWLTAMIALQSVVQLVLVLLAPLVCLAPALGSRGRQAAVRWLALLGFTVAGRAVYAFGLAVILALTDVLAALAARLPYGLGFVLIAASWLVAYRRRHAIFAALSGGHHRNSEELRALLAAGREAVPRAVGAAGRVKRTGRAGVSLARGALDNASGWAHRAGDRPGDSFARARRTSDRDARRERRERRRKEGRALNRLAAHEEASTQLVGVEERLAVNARDRGQVARAATLASDPQDRQALAARGTDLQGDQARLTNERDALRAKTVSPDMERTLRTVQAIVAAERESDAMTEPQAGLTKDDARSAPEAPVTASTGAPGRATLARFVSPDDVARQEPAGEAWGPGVSRWAAELPHGAAMRPEDYARLTPWERWIKKPRLLSADPSHHRLPPPGKARAEMHAKVAENDRARDERREAVNRRQRERRAARREQLERLQRQDEHVKARGERLAEKERSLREREDRLDSVRDSLVDGGASPAQKADPPAAGGPRD